MAPRSIRVLAALAPLFVACALLACGTATKQQVAETALTSMSDEARHESFEATLRVLDENPELVDELYEVARRHRPTFRRFLANASRDLHEPELATMTADLLTRHPDSLAEVLVRTTDATVRRAEARKAMSRAVASRAPETVDVLTDDAKSLSRVLTATLSALEEKPAARTAALAAVRENRGRIVAFVKNDEQLVKEMTEELIREVVDDEPALKKLLRAAGIIEEKEK